MIQAILSIAVARKKRVDVSAEVADVVLPAVDKVASWLRWAPIAALVVMVCVPSVQGIQRGATRDANVAQMGLDITAQGVKSDLGFAAINKRLDNLDKDRDERHREHEADFVQTRADIAALMATEASHAKQLDRIEMDVLRGRR